MQSLNGNVFFELIQAIQNRKSALGLEYQKNALPLPSLFSAEGVSSYKNKGINCLFANITNHKNSTVFRLSKFVTKLF